MTNNQEIARIAVEDIVAGYANEIDHDMIKSLLEAKKYQTVYDIMMTKSAPPDMTKSEWGEYLFLFAEALDYRGSNMCSFLVWLGHNTAGDSLFMNLAHHALYPC